jgi:tRNA(fMet)-specific endonuclease VapC
LLDTDTCSFFVRSDRSVRNRFVLHCGALSISAVTLAELGVWLLRRKVGKRYRNELPNLPALVTVLDLDQDTADRAGAVGARLADQGHSMDLPDLLIAATALVRDLTLATYNTGDFAHVPGLTVVDWLIP